MGGSGGSGLLSLGMEEFEVLYNLSKEGPGVNDLVSPLDPSPA